MLLIKYLRTVLLYLFFNEIYACFKAKLDMAWYICLMLTVLSPNIIKHELRSSTAYEYNTGSIINFLLKRTEKNVICAGGHTILF